MDDFLEHHIHNTLFLDNGVLVLNNDASLQHKESFLDTLTDRYTQANDLSSSFYRRSLKKCKNAAVRIEIPYRKAQKVDIKLFAFSSGHVKMTFLNTNPWVMRYLKQSLSSLITSSTTHQIEINTASLGAKSRLEKALNRREVLHYHINYLYDDDFMSKLYGHFNGFGFNGEEMDKIIRYHAIFELPIGSKPEDLKKRYLKLARRYHPDRVSMKSPQVVNKYTEKFQLLQEAYRALKEAS